MSTMQIDASRQAINVSGGGGTTDFATTAFVFCHTGWKTDSGDSITVNTDNNEYYIDVYKAGGGQWIEWYIWIKEGTYSLTLFYYQSSNATKIDIALDGTNIVSAFDCYIGAFNPHIKTIQTGIVVSTAGTHTVRFTSNGKNASSTDYHMGLFHFLFQRTGA